MMSSMPTLAPGALSGVRVVDFTHWAVGPICTRVLANFGAEVIKIQPPGEYGTEKKGQEDPNSGYGVTGGFSRGRGHNSLNVGKLSTTINVRNPKGLELVERLIRMSDGVVENFSAGVLDKWGLGWNRLLELNPRIVYASLSGFGHVGPLAGWRNYGPTAQAMSGLTLTSGLPGEAPAGWGFAYMDVMGGWYGALGFIMGLYRSRRTGKGERVDYSITESGMSVLGTYFLDFEVNGRRTRRQDFPPGNHSDFPRVAPHNTYRCWGKDRVGQDQWCFIACETQAQFEALCVLMGQETLLVDARFATNEARVQNQDALDGIITSWTQPRSRYEIMDQCQKAGVIAAVVQNGEDRVEYDPQLRHRDVFPMVRHPEAGEGKHEGYPVKLSRTPALLRHAPTWAEHNDYVFGKIAGLSQAEQDQLRKEGVI